MYFCLEKNWKEGWILHSQRETTFPCKLCPAFHSLMLTTVLYSMDTCSLQFSTSGGNGRGNVMFLSTSSQCWQLLRFTDWPKRGKKSVLTLNSLLYQLCHWRNPQGWQILQPVSTSLTLFYCFPLSNDSDYITCSIFHNFDFALFPSVFMFLVNAVSFTLFLSLVCTLYQEHFPVIIIIPVQMTNIFLHRWCSYSRYRSRTTYKCFGRISQSLLFCCW